MTAWKSIIDIVDHDLRSTDHDHRIGLDPGWLAVDDWVDLDAGPLTVTGCGG
jgi:hypothetical protein